MRLLITALIILLVSPAYALKIITIKAPRVLLELEGESLSVGDKLGARDADGKAKGLLEIQQVKGNRAIATILKGQVQPDNIVSKLTGPSSGASAKSKGPKKSTKSEGAWGLLAGYSMNTMEVKPSGTSSVSLSGSSFNLSGFYQMALDGNFSARILGGYETLNATGSSPSPTICSGSDCTAEISYLGIQALGRYSFVRNKSMDVWAGAGLGFLFAMSKSSNILDTSKISTNQTIIGSLGLDYHMGPNNFIPIQFDYAMFPDNNTSSATQMILRFGYGFNF